MGIGIFHIIFVLLVLSQILQVNYTLWHLLGFVVYFAQNKIGSTAK